MYCWKIWNKHGADNLRILHVLANSPPDTNGYAIRSHMIAKHQNLIDNLEVHAITSPFYPQKATMADDFVIDGISYHRCKHPVHRKGNSSISLKMIKKNTKLKKATNRESVETTKNPVLRIFDFFYYGIFKVGRFVKKPFSIIYKVWEERSLMNLFQTEIEEYIIANDIDIVHAHTPYRVGLPAQKAAKKTGKKFVYEVRGIWEETAVANGRWRRNGLAYSRFRRYENKLLKSTPQIISISKVLENDLISRGISKEKITVMPNGIESEKETIHSSRFDEIKSKVESMQGEITIGYIGSLRHLEGVDLTAKAVSNIVNKGHPVNLFCLTGKDGQEELSDLCNQLGLADRNLITGPVPHKEVGNFYELIDIFVVSRPDYPVTRIVTPLKPYEAMVRSRPVVVTNLPALKEIVNDRKTGIVTKEVTVESLENSIIELILDERLRGKIGNQAKEWVLENRNWSTLVKNYVSIYNK